MTRWSTSLAGFALMIVSAIVSAVEEHRHLLLRRTEAACKYDNDCVENAYCWNMQTCLCKDDFLVDRNRTHFRCLRMAHQLGDACSVDVQCTVTFTPRAECRDGKCQCSIGSHFQDGRCYASLRIGQICGVSNDCYIEDSPSYCASGICTCPLQHHPNEDGTKCIRSSDLLDQCSSDLECVVKNSRCVDVCRCKIDHVMSNDNKSCLKAANTVGEACAENSQCTEFLRHGRCINGFCDCEARFHQSGPVCSRSRELNQECDDHSQCITPTNTNRNTTEVTNVDCISGFCKCASGYELTESLSDCIRSSGSSGGQWEISWSSFFLTTVIAVSQNQMLFRIY